MCRSVTPFCSVTFSNVSVCLVFWLNYYIAACRALGVPLLGEKLFRFSEHKTFVPHRPFGGSAVSARLQKTPHALIFCRRTLYLCDRYPFRLLVKSVSAVSGRDIMVVNLLLFFLCVCVCVCVRVCDFFWLLLFLIWFLFCFFVWLFVCCCFCFLFGLGQLL